MKTQPYCSYVSQFWLPPVSLGTYEDGRGLKRFKGTSDLRASQSGGPTPLMYVLVHRQRDNDTLCSGVELYMGIQAN